jgi:hypothetical protein
MCYMYKSFRLGGKRIWKHASVRCLFQGVDDDPRSVYFVKRGASEYGLEKGNVLFCFCIGYCEVAREGVFILFVSPKFPLCVLWRHVIEM